VSIQAGQSLHFVRLDNEIVYRETPYMLRKEPKRFAWLARLCWKLLHRLNALEMYSEKVVRWTYTKEAQETLTKMVMKMGDFLWEAADDPERYVVVCGAEDFHEALRSPEMRHEMVFSIGPFGSDRPYRRMFNMDVHVVPYLSGIAVIPRVVVEKQARAA
jgi:hypothetical protein